MVKDPLIITPHNVLSVQIIEGDCACASPPQIFVPPLHRAHSPATQYTIPPLHFAPLREDFFLAFNPIGQAGVVVLNQSAVNLLQRFKQPQTLESASQMDGMSEQEATTIRRLVDLELLTPLDHPLAPPKHPPQSLTAWLHVTNACNLRCDYCYLHKTQEEMEVARGKEAVEAVFRSALANHFRRVKFKYAGGEATLNFSLVLALHAHARELATQHSLEVEGVVLSNGVALSQKMIEELRAHDLRLMISLDGVGAEHDAQRHFINGAGSFRQVERSLDRLAAANFLPSISITISNRTLAGLPSLVEYLLQRDLPFSLNFYRENECSASFADLTYAEDQLIGAMKAAFEVIEGNLPSYSLLASLVDRARLDTPHTLPCGVGDSYLVIDQFGRVAKCHMEIEKTLTDISVADPLHVIRTDQIGLQNLPVEEKEGCRTCEWRYWCAGGCPVLTHRVTGRYDVKSPNCRVYKAVFPEVLRLEGLRLLQYGSPLS